MTKSDLLLAGAWAFGVACGYVWRYWSVKDIMWRALEAKRDLDVIHRRDMMRGDIY